MISAKVTKKWNIGALWPTDVAESPPFVAKDGQLNVRCGVFLRGFFSRKNELLKKYCRFVNIKWNI